MTVPRDVTDASERMLEWFVELKERAMLRSTNQSYAMMRAVLHEVRDRLPVERALRFADALPPLARGIMLEQWHPAAAPPRGAVLDAVRARLEPHSPPPDGIVEDVLAVLAHRADPGARSTLTEHMPPDLQAEWRAAMAAAPP